MQGLTLKALLLAIEKAKDPQVFLSSAIRVYVGQYLHDNRCQQSRALENPPQDSDGSINIQPAYQPVRPSNVAEVRT